jgi:AcrR family transcriptional regulator/transposase
MFAEQGYRGVSLRAVMRECGVNAAAVHYHFGSKEALLEEIFMRRAGALNEARLRLLKRCLPPAAPDDALMLERILYAYLSPAFSLPDGDEGVRRFTRLRSVIAHESAELSQHLITRHFNETSGHFIVALRRVLPWLPESALFWRFHFLLGAQYYTLSNPGRIESLSGGSCDAGDLQNALDEMVAFVAAGLRAPLPERATQGTPTPRRAGAAWPLDGPAPGVSRAGSGKLGMVGANANVAAAEALADAQIDDRTWAALAALLASHAPRRGPKRGRKPITDREAVSGIVYVVRHRLRWRDLPAEGGFRSSISCWRRLREWEASGTWPAIERVLREQLADGAALDFSMVTSKAA